MNNINENENEKGKIRSSQSSINSNPEFKDTHIYYLRIALIIINIISLISGFFIFYNREYYLSSEYKFEYQHYLYTFIILYSLGMIGALIISFLFSLLIKLFIYIMNLISNNEPKPLIKNEEKLSENSIRYINNHSNEFSLIPYTFTLFIIITTIIYFISLPYSIFLFIFLIKNKYYSNLNDFCLLYFFIFINALAGFILFYVLVFIIFIKRDGSFRQTKFFIDDNNLNNLRNEIKDAMGKADK